MRNVIRVGNSLRIWSPTSSLRLSAVPRCQEYYGKRKREQNEIGFAVGPLSLQTNHERLFHSKYSLASLIPIGVQCSRQYSTSKPLVEESNISQVAADLFFPEFPTIQGAEAFIAGIHTLTGLPWWSTVIVSGFLLRVLLPLPLSIYSMHNAVRLQRLQPEMKQISEGLKKEVSMAMHQFGWDEKKAKREFIKNMKRHMRKLYIRDNCHPMKDTASYWIRLPIWVSASFALRNMSVRANNPLLDNHEMCQSMSVEGLAWFADLTMVDSTWVLPVAMGAVTLLNVEINRRSMSKMTTYRRYLTYGLRGLSLVFIPISAYLPSGLVLYWISSGVFTAMQTVLVDRSESFRRLIGIKALSQTNQDQPKSNTKS